MSDPTRVRIITPGPTYVSARYAQMHCDHQRCRIPPARAPRVVIPSKTWLVPGHLPLKMMTTLHYCERHKGEVALDDLMRDKQRAEVEAVAKKKRPADFRCDFDAAFIEWILVSTPEYRKFLSAIELNIGAERRVGML